MQNKQSLKQLKIQLAAKLSATLQRLTNAYNAVTAKKQVALTRFQLSFWLLLRNRAAFPLNASAN